MASSHNRPRALYIARDASSAAGFHAEVGSLCFSASASAYAKLSVHTSNSAVWLSTRVNGARAYEQRIAALGRARAAADLLSGFERGVRANNGPSNSTSFALGKTPRPSSR